MGNPPKITVSHNKLLTSTKIKEEISRKIRKYLVRQHSTALSIRYIEQWNKESSETVFGQRCQGNSTRERIVFSANGAGTITKPQRDGMGREVGGGFMMGNTRTPMEESTQCMAKPIQYCKV